MKFGIARNWDKEGTVGGGGHLRPWRSLRVDVRRIVRGGGPRRLGVRDRFPFAAKRGRTDRGRGRAVDPAGDGRGGALRAGEGRGADEGGRVPEAAEARVRVAAPATGQPRARGRGRGAAAGRGGPRIAQIRVGGEA